MNPRIQRLAEQIKLSVPDSTQAVFWYYGKDGDECEIGNFLPPIVHLAFFRMIGERSAYFRTSYSKELLEAEWTPQIQSMLDADFKRLTKQVPVDIPV